MPKTSTAVSVTIPPPVKGWNTRDPVSLMDEQYAVEMVNFFPGFGSVDIRNGQTLQNTLGTNAISLGTFKYGTTDALLVATNSGTLLNVTPGTGAGTDITGGAAITGSLMYFQQFKDRVFITGDFGLADVYHWTGTGNIAASAFTGPGGDDKLLGPMASYKNRLYFAYRAAFVAATPRNGLLEIWYGGFDAITGALTQFSLNAIFRMGGYVSFIGSVTRAKDFSEDELFCIISSEGEILLYQGDNPEASNWGLVGHYYIPPPCGPRAFFYFGSNLIIITRQGVYGMDSILSGGFGGKAGSSILNTSLDEIIKSAFVAAVNSVTLAQYDDLIWTGIYYPRGNYLLINIPLSNNASEQFIMNTVTGAWCRFTNQNAFSWIVYQDRLYYVNPQNTKLMRADDGYLDADPIGGATRVCKLRPAYNYFGDRTLVKNFTMARPVMYQSEGMQLTMDADIDYANTTATQTVTPDNTDTAYKFYQPVVGLKGIGKAASIRIDQSVTTKRMSIQAIEVTFNSGDIL